MIYLNLHVNEYLEAVIFTHLVIGYGTSLIFFFFISFFIFYPVIHEHVLIGTFNQLSTMNPFSLPASHTGLLDSSGT